MIHFCLDTSTDTLSLTLFKETSVLAVYEGFHPKQHASCLLPKILDLFAQTAYTLSDLSSINVGIGPGSFTGSRIACSVAQGLSFARKIPLCGISLFQAMAAYALMNLSQKKESALFILFEDSSHKEVYGQFLSQELLPLRGDQGVPFYMPKQEFLEQVRFQEQSFPIICASKDLLASECFSLCSKISVEPFWEKASYWIGIAAFLLREQNNCSEAFPLYVRPSYVDPSFKKPLFPHGLF